ncbi:UNVERIFIED_CONTAM: GDSL esterase/lipase [Sesamum calycinum]|uniref:GDSL esterase/lipase n=1 Tax=Sesamum calycinum TaxID=2727403 RepID=A0AAW2MMN1_9LAMI
MEGIIENARVLFVAIVLVSLALYVKARRIPAAPPCDFPAIYNFGDSNSDTGGISAAFWPIPPPYGVSYFHRPAGRNSDGRLIIDFIAEHLGLPYLSSYLDSIGTNFRHGANFATGGSTIRRQNESIFENGISPFSLDIQTMQFDQFKARTSELYHQDPSSARKLPRPKEFSRALYTFDIGQNDIAAGFRKLTMPQLRAAIPDIVDQFAAAVTNLYQRGARTFWIHNTGPIGCLPVATVKVQDPVPGYLDEHGCVQNQNEIAIEFNRLLKNEIVELRLKLSEARIIHVDMYRAKHELITNAKNQGFEDPFKICCGHHGIGYDVWCGNKANLNGSEVFAGSCANPSKVISWDGVHYSEAANRWIANHIINGSFSDPPIPISRACHKA